MGQRIFRYLRRVVAQFVQHYNEVRIHSAVGFVTPKDKLEGRDKEIFVERDRKLEAARAEGKTRRQAARRKVRKQIPCVVQPLMAN